MRMSVIVGRVNLMISFGISSGLAAFLVFRRRTVSMISHLVMAGQSINCGYCSVPSKASISERSAWGGGGWNLALRALGLAFRWCDESAVAESEVFRVRISCSASFQGFDLPMSPAVRRATVSCQPDGAASRGSLLMYLYLPLMSECVS